MRRIPVFIFYEHIWSQQKLKIPYTELRILFDECLYLPYHPTNPFVFEIQKSQSPQTVTAPPKKEPESALNDLLSLGNELSFGSNIVNQASQQSTPFENTSRAMFASQPVPPAQNSQMLDPFSFGAPQQNVAQNTGMGFNQNQNIFGGDDQYQKPSSSNPFNFMDQQSKVSNFQQTSAVQQSNPFDNPFAGKF